VEHAGPVVPVGEHAAVRPPVAYHVPQAERLQVGERGPLRRRDVCLPDESGRVEHVVVVGRDVHVTADQDRLRALRHHVPEGGEPGQLVAVVVGIRHPAVRHVDGMHPHAGAGRGDRPRLGSGKAGLARQPGDHVVEPRPGQDGDPVPLRLPVDGERVAPGLELGAEQFGERGVGELDLLQAHDVGLPFVEPWQQPRNPLLDGVDVPGGYSHVSHDSRLSSVRRRGFSWMPIPGLNFMIRLIRGMPEVRCGDCRPPGRRGMLSEIS
jgi:hypothetical protein